MAPSNLLYALDVKPRRGSGGNALGNGRRYGLVCGGIIHPLATVAIRPKVRLCLIFRLATSLSKPQAEIGNNMHF